MKTYLAVSFGIVAGMAVGGFVRWSRFTGQFGGKAKMDFKFDYAASFSSFSCVA